ncbi:MAG: RHS repeat-associated core domain-containing protein [Sulfobacillus sp.]
MARPSWSSTLIIRGWSNSSGALVDSYTYEPYGGIQSQTQNVAQPFKWIGAVYDSATGLYYIGHRYYDPNFDRWTQMDPVYMGTMSNPQSLDGLSRQSSPEYTPPTRRLKLCGRQS